MKKVLIFSFLIIAILISFFNTSYAVVNVTGDKIFDFYQKLTNQSLAIKYAGENGNSNQSSQPPSMRNSHNHQHS